MDCPKCNSQVRLKMTGAVCNNYPCTWSTSQLRFVEQTPANEDGDYTITFKDDDSIKIEKTMNLFDV